MSDLGDVTFEATPSAGVRWHEYATWFPMLEGEQRETLLSDIREHGIRQPIVFLDGAILDGRNRYMCARELGLQYPRCEYIGDDPLGFVLSLNLSRRHLSESQRAMIAAKVANSEHGGDRKSDQGANLPLDPLPTTNSEAAKKLNVSRRLVRTARSVQEGCVPEIRGAVDRAEISVSAAAQLASLPKEEQRQLASDGVSAMRDRAKRLRKERKGHAAKAGEANDHGVDQSAPVEQSSVQEDPYGYAKLTPEALIDQCNGLKADLDDAKSEIKALRSERADFEQRWKEATQDDMGRALGNAQRRLSTLDGRIAELQRTIKREEYKRKLAEKRIAELEGTEIPL